MEKRSASQVRHFTAMAKQLMKHHFGVSPKRISHQASGLTNFVYDARIPEGEFIVRISSSPEKINDYIKEQWAVAHAEKAGIPVAEILEVGNNAIPHPYMIQKKLRGSEAGYHKERLNIIRQMGKYAAVLHKIPTNGFGQVFDWSENKLSKNATWKEFLEKEVRVKDCLSILRKLRMLNNGSLERLSEQLVAIEKLNIPPVFNHGDLRLKNIIIDKDACILALIDWEESSSNIPYWDLSIALHDLSIDEKEAFLDGYGMDAEQFARIAHFLKALNLINYGPALEKMRANSAQLDHYRLRLNGHLDLYSL